MRRKPAIWHDQLEPDDPIFMGPPRFVVGNRAQPSEDDEITAAEEDDSQPQEVRILVGPLIPIEEYLAQLEAEEAEEAEAEEGEEQPQEDKSE